MSAWSSGNNTYTHKDMVRMQQEAVERVREMQKRARAALEEEPRPVYPDFVRQPQAQDQQRDGSGQTHEYERQTQQNRREGAGGILSGLGGSLGSLLSGDGNGPISRVMETLGIDNDKIIILLLLLILINNQADKKLILALCYVLL